MSTEAWEGADGRVWKVSVVVEEELFWGPNGEEVRMTEKEGVRGFVKRKVEELRKVVVSLFWCCFGGE